MIVQMRSHKSLRSHVSVDVESMAAVGWKEGAKWISSYFQGTTEGAGELCSIYSVLLCS